MTGTLDGTITTAIFFFFKAEDGIRDVAVTGVQTCALPISCPKIALVAAVESPCLADGLPQSIGSSRRRAPPRADAPASAAATTISRRPCPLARRTRRPAF